MRGHAGSAQQPETQIETGKQMTIDPDEEAARLELEKKNARNEYKRCRMKFNRTIDSSLVAVSLHVCTHVLYMHRSSYN